MAFGIPQHVLYSLFNALGSSISRPDMGRSNCFQVIAFPSSWLRGHRKRPFIVLGLSKPIPKPEPKKRKRKPKLKEPIDTKPKRPRGRPRKDANQSAGNL